MPDQVSPPKDNLQKLLGPLQNLDPYQFQNGYHPSVPSLDETLQWEHDGLPIWWPQDRGEAGPPWSPSERRLVLLRNLREQLPSTFPASPQTFSEQQTLVDTLRRIYDGVLSGASDILSLS
jgi:hypothetical protein